MPSFYCSGEVGNQRQGEIIKDLAKLQPIVPPEVKERVRTVVHELHQSEHTT